MALPSTLNFHQAHWFSNSGYLYNLNSVGNLCSSWELLDPCTSSTWSSSDFLDNHLGLLASHGICVGLDLEHAAIGVLALGTEIVHSLLKRIALPSKEIITVLTISSSIPRSATVYLYQDTRLTRRQSYTRMAACRYHNRHHSYIVQYPT